MTAAVVQMGNDSALDSWLTAVGFRFDPFVFLDAGADPHLGAYLVGHGAFAALWGDWPALAFAPAGGGKTALRVQMVRACWSGPDVGHPFPIPYIPSFDAAGRLPATQADHLTGVLQAGALWLLMALLTHPHWWTALDGEARRTVRGLLERDLPAPLTHYLAEAAESAALRALFAGIDPAAAPTAEPAAERWLPLCSELAQMPTAKVPASAVERMQTLVDLLLGPLKLSAIYLLVDGMDGFAETAADPATAVDLIGQVLASAKGWTGRGVFLKAFLPLETARIVADRFPVLRQVPQATLRWSPPLLAEVVRQRVYVATQGAYGSLDAISTPDLRVVETQLARLTAPLPREVLVLTHRLLWEHARHDGQTERLSSADLQAASAWYAVQRERLVMPVDVAG
jgi:hypothetical protein